MNKKTGSLQTASC